MSAHTPGPWHVEGETRVYSVDSGGFLASTWERFVSDTRDTGESWIEMRDRTKPQRDAADAECKANARLIAAAPELLAALVKLSTAVDLLGCPQGGLDGYDWLISANESVDALIANATGATS